MIDTTAVARPRLLSSAAVVLVAGVFGCGSETPAREAPVETPVELDAGVPCERVVHRADRDGDGWLVDDPTAPASCGDRGGSGYAERFDCDDADPAAYTTVYRDADGDGWVLPDDSMKTGRAVPRTL